MQRLLSDIVPLLSAELLPWSYVTGAAIAVLGGAGFSLAKPRADAGAALAARLNVGLSVLLTAALAMLVLQQSTVLQQPTARHDHGHKSPLAAPARGNRSDTAHRGAGEALRKRAHHGPSGAFGPRLQVHDPK